MFPVNEKTGRFALLQNGFNVFFELIVVTDSEVAFNDLAFLIDDDQHGDRAHLELRGNLLGPLEHRIGNAVFGCEGLHRIPIALVERYAEHNQPLAAVFFVQFLDSRNGFAARRAPGGPEVDQHRLALKIGKLDRLTV